MRRMAYIKAKDLALGYDGRVVTEHIEFEVGKGDYLCIVGENGAGKSTLMKTLLHLIRPVSGSLSYGDGVKEAEIGYLPQQTMVQRDFPASVWEVVLSGNLSRCGHRPFYGKKERERAMENLERMGIADLKKKCYRKLSGGQQQRVLLARALCATTKLLVLDEPVTGLDPKAASELYALIEELNKGGVTIIMVSHDLQAAVQYATHILHVGRKQLYFGTRDAYLDSDAWKEFGEKSDPVIASRTDPDGRSASGRGPKQGKQGVGKIGNWKAAKTAFIEEE